MEYNEYIINCNKSLADIFEKIGSIPEKVLIVVDDQGRVLGTITDGDIRRSLSKTEGDFTALTPKDILNPNFVYDLHNDIVGNKNSFTSSVEIIPVLDEKGFLKHIRKKQIKQLNIGKKTISGDSPAYIIAEIGNNHNGSLDLAFKLIDKAKEAGADAAKFQMRQLSKTYIKSAKDAVDEDLGSQYILDLLKKFQLSNHELIQCFNHCKSIGIEPLCTPWDIESVQMLSQYGLEGYKVASADLTNYELLEALSETNKPVILSTGMSSDSQIKHTVNYLDGLISEYALLHCNSAYPAPYKDINLHYIKKLKQISSTGIIGYSGHERGIEVPIAAIALGAKVIEKHFTIDKGMEGSDHKVSLLPEEFKEMVSCIRNVENSLIFSETRVITQGEIMNRESLGKSVVAKRPITLGSIITKNDVTLKSPGKGLSPDMVGELIGKKSIRSMEADEFFFPSDLQKERATFSKYKFNREFGIPVRYHDIDSLGSKSNFNFLEFHLSYGDMGSDLSKFIQSPFHSLSYYVHAPELFENDHVLDLASRDKVYRAKSIENLERVIDETLRIAPFFPDSVKPLIVFNAGGFSENEFVSSSYREESYSIIEDSLLAFKDLEDCELLIQTMPPFPWHFGGQRFHNNFVNHLEIQSFCERTGYDICFDLSHYQLACNYYGFIMDEFLDAVKKHVRYMHIVDAKGIDGEGLQIGDGQINFDYFADTLNRLAIGAGFIPEIWQGHKDGGRGFIEALDRLQNIGL